MVDSSLRCPLILMMVAYQPYERLLLGIEGWDIHMDCSLCILPSRIPATVRPTRRPSQTLLFSDENSTIATVDTSFPWPTELNRKEPLNNGVVTIVTSFIPLLNSKWQGLLFLLYYQKDWPRLGVRWLVTLRTTPHWLFPIFQPCSTIHSTFIT